ncbi:MAG: hypothetical protein Q7J15_10965 [Candidatus Desulfaltia sp.]|nr:hypothetical protein [Candidatus Desulfaltia sp.]
MKTSNEEFLERIAQKAIEEANKLDVDEPKLVWPEPEEVEYQGPETKPKKTPRSEAFSRQSKDPLGKKSPEYQEEFLSELFDMVKDGSLVLEPLESKELLTPEVSILGGDNLIPESKKAAKKEELAALDKVEREATSKFQQDNMFEPNQQGLFGKAISRSEAFEIANKYVKTCPLEECVGIREILSIEEIVCRRPCIYGHPDEKMKNYWIAYLSIPSKRIMLSSSTILLISKETGEIIYAGSANDEG